MRNIKSGSVKLMAVMLIFIVILSFLPADTAKAAVITKNNVEEMPIQLLGYEANTVTFDREIISIRAYSDSEYVTYKKVSYNKLCFIGRKCGRRYIEVMTGDHKIIKCYVRVNTNLYIGKGYLRDVTTSKDIKSVSASDKDFVHVYRYDDTKRGYAIELWNKTGKANVVVRYTDGTFNVIKVITSPHKHSWIRVADKTEKVPVFKKTIVKKAVLTWPDGSDASQFYSGNIDTPFSNSKLIGWCQKHCTACNGKYATQPDPQGRCASTVTCKIKNVTKWVKTGTKTKTITSHVQCRYCGEVK